MRRLVLSLVAVLAVAGVARSQDPEASWPELSDFGFVSGRPATDEDAEAGDAVFVLKVEDEIVGEPLDLEIPQYAIHIDVDTGAETRVIVIQAEGYEGTEIIGAVVVVSGATMAGLLNEFRLLGTEAPPAVDPGR